MMNAIPKYVASKTLHKTEWKIEVAGRRCG